MRVVDKRELITRHIHISLVRFVSFPFVLFPFPSPFPSSPPPSPLSPLLDLCGALEMFIKHDLRLAPQQALIPCDVFRKELLYTEEMDDFLYSYMPFLEAIFNRWVGGRRKAEAMRVMFRRTPTHHNISITVS